MNVLIFGASGPTGQMLIHEALNKGYKVIAFVRNPEKITFSHSDLEIIKGDAMNYADVENAVSKADVIISAIGVRADVKDKELPPVRSVSAMNIVTAMQKLNKKRLICITSQGAGDTKRSSGLFGNIFVPLFWKNRFRDVNKQEQIITESNLDYTLVRPPALTNRPKTSKVFAGKYFTVFFDFISRADLAEFIINEIGKKQWLRKAVSVKNV